MLAVKVRGTAAIPEGQTTIPPTSQNDMDKMIANLQANKDKWGHVALTERVQFIERLISDHLDVAEQWVQEANRFKGISAKSHAAGEEWLGGPFTILRNLRQLRQSLLEIEKKGRPVIQGPNLTLESGQIMAQVVPYDRYDWLFYHGFVAEVWMEPGVTLAQLPETQAVAYHEQTPGSVVLVLSAGNVASIGPTDALYKLFVENKVVLLKTNPINDYLGPLIERSFRCLIEKGFFRIAYGGSHEGSYLCHHAGIDEVHITGSDKTHDAIVFGTGEEGRQRKEEREPLLTKPITSELGNVSGVIVVPGPWSADDIDFHAANITSMLVNNAGFNCTATRVIVQQRDWEGRAMLNHKIKEHLSAVPQRLAYYPGAHDRYDAFLQNHPEAAQIGKRTDRVLPWLLATDLDPEQQDDIFFTTEAFCSLFGETALPAQSVAEYIDDAVSFVNDRLWGTLNVSLIVHPQSLLDKEIRQAVEQAIAKLRFGTVCVNHWGGLGFGLMTTPWGAFPGHDIYDIQSGRGFVHNTLMFSRIQKTVIRGPFRVKPTPVWFMTNKNARKIAKKAAKFEASPSPLKIPGLFWSAIRG